MISDGMGHFLEGPEREAALRQFAGALQSNGYEVQLVDLGLCWMTPCSQQAVTQPFGTPLCAEHYRAGGGTQL